MQELRQSTGVDIRIGPAMDATDGVTPETTLALGTADQAELLKHNGAATVDISSNTFAAVTGCDGWYDLTLTTTDTNTLGLLDIVVQDTSLCTPIFARCMVVDADYYDAKYGTAGMPSQVIGYGSQAFETGTIQTGSATAPTLAAGATSDNINGCLIFFDGGTGAGQGALIDSYNTSSKVATLNKTLETAVSTDTTYIIIPLNFNVISASNPIESTSPGVLQSTTIATRTSQTVFTLTDGSADDDAYPVGSPVVIIDQTTQTQKQVGSVGDYVGTGKELTLSADPGIFTTAVGDYVHILAATGSAASAPTVAQIADGVWDEARSSHTGGGSFGETMGTVETNIDNLDAAITSRSSLDAAGVRTAVGLAAANLDTQLSNIDTDTGTTIPNLIGALNDPTAAAIASAVWATVCEAQGSYTAQQIMSIVLSALAGVTSNGGDTLETPNGVATRITATTDASNNRTAMTLNPSS